MSDKSAEDLKLEEAIRQFDAAVSTRNLEISLFWQRSLFFWGFIAAAFIAYAQLKEDPFSRIAVCCFGLVCSTVWTLANRGSKYWYEAWEQKVEDVQKSVIGIDLFSESKPIVHPSFWGAKRYSVTRLAIALSDFTVLAWVYLGIAPLSALSWKGKDLAAVALIWLAFGYAMSLFFGGRSRSHSRN